jgi:penicillin amidase
VLVGLSMTEFLNHGLYKDELEREKVLAKLGPELTADLFVNSSWRDHPPGTDTTSIENEIPGETTPDEEEDPAPKKKSNRVAPEVKPQILRLAALAQDDKTAGEFYGAGLQGGATEDGLHAGSNNWVVSGAHTASGKPLLSNDMHLDLRIPNVWYEAHLTAGDFDVAGVTLPGVPFVIAGHNRSIAWGFTNLGPNVEDLYIETFNDKGEYLTPQGWVQPEHRKEIIRVKGKPEVNVDVEVTRHGPIISDIIPGEKRKLALKWIIYDPQAASAPFFDVDSAKNWQVFRAAFSHFGTPGQNVVYADGDGHIGYQATGLVPIRAAGDGSVPVPGDDDSHEWTGYVPYDKLPSVYDPPSGTIATANGRVTPDGYPYTVSIEWGPPYRTERIYRLLNAKKKLTPPDMLAIQADTVSAFDRYCAERLVYAVDRTSTASRRARSAADLMRNWDGAMSTDSAAPTVAYFSRMKLEELLLKPKLGDDWKQYIGLLAAHPKWFMSSVWLENILSHQPARWLPQGYADYDALLTAAVEGAVSDAEAPTALAMWKWGRVHRVDIKHPFWSNFPILKRAAGPGPQPLSGDGETVKQVSTHFGPSERFTVDFSDLDNSTLNIVNGQSGNIFDEHYNDQWDAYYHARTFAWPFSAAAVQRAGVHHLTLEP